MPDYYAGPSAANSFSQGLMAGYQFVDNIRQRKLDNQDRERTRRLQERADDRAQNADQRAETDFKLGQEDRLRQIDRENSVDLAHATASSLLAFGGIDKIPESRRAALINAARTADKDLAQHSDDEVWQSLEANMNTHDFRGAEMQAQLRQLGEREDGIAELLGGVNQRSAPASQSRVAPQPRSNGAPQPPAPTSLGGAATTALASVGKPGAPVPKDLVTSYESEYSGPYGGGKVSISPKPVSKDFGSSGKGIKLFGLDFGVLSPNADKRSAATRVTEEPLAYTDAYLERRHAFDDKQRAELDTKVIGALQQDIATSKAAYEAAKEPRDKATQGRRLVTRQEQLNKFANTASSETVDAAVPRSVAPGDKAATVLTQAVEAQQAAGRPILKEGEARALATSVSRMGGEAQTRLSPTQIKRTARLVATGAMTLEQGQNYVRYGRLDKPEKPTFQPLNSEYAVMITENGASLVELPASKKDGSGSGESNAQKRLLVNDRIEQISTSLKGEFGAGKGDAQDVIQHTTAFLQVLQREAQNIERQTGIQLIDRATGEVDLSMVPATAVPDLIQGYKKYNDGEVDAWFKDGKPAASYFPQGGGAPAAGGWSVTPVQ